MIRVRYRLDLCLQAPVLTQAAGTLRLGMDAAAQRYRGQPVLNGSLIRGNLRHLLQRFARDLAGVPDTPPGCGPADAQGSRPVADADLTAWFGPDQQQAGGEPLIAGLSFDLFWRLCTAESPGEPAQPVRHRIALGPEGTVETGQIQVAESAFPVGSEPCFTGEIRARFTDHEARRHAERWLGKALALLPALGAQKGVGYGRVLRAELTRLEPVARVLPPLAADPPPGRIGLVLHLDRPFNLAQSARFKPENNRYLNHDEIPGSAIKAVLARAHGGGPRALHADLDFDRLVVTAALPAPLGRPARALPLPLSLAVFDAPDRREVLDLGLEAGPCLLQAGDRRLAPRFLPDWKQRHRDAAESRCGRDAEPPEHLLLVRTAIRPLELVPEESQLFALDCTDTADHCWCLDLDLSQVHVGDPAAHRDAVTRLLALLREGLWDLGKTRAGARVEVLPRPFSDTAVPEPLGKDRLGMDGRDGWLVLLRTPARMLPADLDQGRLPPSGGAAALKAAYADYWAGACPGLALSHYYAQQELVGGEYYQRHFRASQPDGQDYRAEWLTRAGSVFLLTSDPTERARVQTCLADWLRGGLPQAADRAAETWETNPYLGENGFGEIAVNDPRQLALTADPARLVRLAQEDP